MPRPKKSLSSKEKKFATMLAQGYGGIEAARKALGWPCETGSPESQKARDLARSDRIKTEVERLKHEQEVQAEAQQIIKKASKTDVDSLRQFVYERLVEVRDDISIPAPTRWKALNALEKLRDPSRDINLIWRWIDLMWRGYVAHCPCCHTNNPLSRIHNKKLDEHRKRSNLSLDTVLESPLQRRLFVLSQSDKRKSPHPTQLRALTAPERHLAGLGAARSGKSLLLAMFGNLYFNIPGAEIWILAQVYESARSEIEFISNYLETAYYPVTKHMIKMQEDKSGEISFTSRWGSKLIVKSGRALGSIVGRELEAALVAEPAWVDASLFEEIRARMSSRLGRIIAVGTPKGYGGFIYRLTKMSGFSGKGHRIKPEDRLIENGCPWGKSIFVFNMDPKENPEYVKSELEAAREELSEAEYASEFEGQMKSAEGAKFPFIKEEHLRPITKDEFDNCMFVLGVDQGERNFAGCLLGWDGEKIYVCNEYFDNTNVTIKANMMTLNKETPSFIANNGGRPENWVLTIFDADPPVWNYFDELIAENRPWKTEITYRPKSQKEFLHWRNETYAYINHLASENKIIFDSRYADLLHEQVVEALNKPQAEGSENVSISAKGWKIPGYWRGDHVMDAFVLAMWTLFSQQIQIPKEVLKPQHSFIEAKRAWEFNFAMQEKAEMSGKPVPKATEHSEFEKIMGRPFPIKPALGRKGYYDDA